MSFICAIWVRAPTNVEIDVSIWLWMAVVILFVAYSQMSLTAQLIEAAIASVLSCFAESPQRLRETHPILFHRFVRIAEFSSFHRTPLQL